MQIHVLIGALLHPRVCVEGDNRNFETLTVEPSDAILVLRDEAIPSAWGGDDGQEKRREDKIMSCHDNRHRPAASPCS